jgi:hypothetical protein
VLLTVRVLVLMLLRLPVASLLVDVDFLVVLLGTADTLLLGDVNLFLDVRVAVGRLLGLADGGREGFVSLFVTFPSV